MSGDFDNNPRPPGVVPPSAGKPPSARSGGDRPTVRVDRRPGADRVYVTAFDADSMSLWVQVEGDRWTRVELTRDEADVVAFRLMRMPQAAKRIATLGCRASELVSDILDTIGKHGVELWMVRDKDNGIKLTVAFQAIIVARVRRLLGTAPQADESIT